ncbi:uncharacterized protein SCHCODRAFT_01084592 [Schizophyllum commune H4-8]|nr:uncharacterized protein SCHCODRAFT_01084592 [Schizophyllum commune H4-8]KAI5899886.1 hypothetical protein SCHCODRAFT_01084592 [Schizophyllum commune H4-8]
MARDNPTARPVANARDSHSPSVTSGTSLAPSSPAESATSPSNSAASSAPEGGAGQREGVADQPEGTETTTSSVGRISYTPNGLPIAPWRLSHQEMVALQVLTRSHREGPLAFYQPYPPGVDPEYLHSRVYKGHGAPNGPP